jgi:short-subunit dehydrogenase involved in D-alanine esterification of teichoic acids
MANILVTGGGCGIGLELARQLAKLPDSKLSKNFITTRANPLTELKPIMESTGKQ